MENGRTFAEQADSLAALLDTLGIDKVVVLGGSGGGPTAIQFAARHPQRTIALLTECAVTGSFTHPKADQMNTCTTRCFMTSPTLSRFMSWYSLKSPESFVKMTLDEMSTLNDQEKAEATTDIINDPERMAFMPKLVKLSESAMLYSRFEALILDVENFKERVPFEQV